MKFKRMCAKTKITGSIHQREWKFMIAKVMKLSHYKCSDCAKDQRSVISDCSSCLVNRGLWDWVSHPLPHPICFPPHTHTYTHARTHARMCTHARTHTRIHTHTHTHTYTHTIIQAHIVCCPSLIPRPQYRVHTCTVDLGMRLQVSIHPIPPWFLTWSMIPRPLYQSSVKRHLQESSMREINKKKLAYFILSLPGSFCCMQSRNEIL